MVNTKMFHHKASATRLNCRHLFSKDHFKHLGYRSNGYHQQLIMQNAIHVPRSISQYCKKGVGPFALKSKHFKRSTTTVSQLESTDVKTFRNEAFRPGLPYKLRLSDETVIATSRKWFKVDRHSNFHLNEQFWTVHKNTIVPLEITRFSEDGDVNFERIQAPLELLIQSISVPNQNPRTQISIYLAQHDLRDLPQQLHDDLPAPKFVSHAGKGDLYGSSIWMGKAPTYTPLHRDPNPNILFHMAGKKVIRLFDPTSGSAIFDHVQHTIRGTTMAGNIRGEEMMIGQERSLLHDLVWDEASSTSANIMRSCHEATLEAEEALFIPQGWWHSVKGIGDGISASVNWWFR